MMLRYYSATAAATLLLMLSGRDMLLATNLFDNGLGLREKETVTCDERSLGARTEDGTCNDKKIPLMGAVDVPLGRNVDPKEVVKTQKHLLSPNPILLSRTLMSRESEGSEFKVKELPLNLLVTAWIQFQNHDWFDHSNTELDRTSYIKVPIPAPYRKDFALDESDVFGNILEDLKGLAGLNEFMLVPKTKVVGTRKDSNGQSYEIFSNRVTHWWDGSQMKGGLMKLDPNSKLLPLAESDQDPVTSAHGYQTGYLAGVEKTGFVENWWTGMSLLHNLFLGPRVHPPDEGTPREERSGPRTQGRHARVRSRARPDALRQSSSRELGDHRQDSQRGLDPRRFRYGRARGRPPRELARHPGRPTR